MHLILFFSFNCECEICKCHSPLVTVESRPALQTEGLEVGSAYMPMPRPRMAVLHARMVSLKSTTL